VITHSVIYGQIVFRFAVNILQVTSSSKGYVLFMFTHRAHVCERAYARARVINCSLTYGRFLFKFAVNILQITISSKGYVLFMFMHRAHVCDGACASAHVVKHSIILDGFFSNLMSTCYK
jgi:hypothetical protein